MAFDIVPWIIDGTTVDAEVIRRALSTLINPAGGIVTAGDLAVTQQATPNMSVQMGVGQVWVPGSSTTTQGLYYGRNAAAATLPIAAANATNPRIDQVIVQVQDPFYAGSTKSMAPAVITGTATSGASLTNLVGLGAVPASSMVIANVLVPANATSIVTADIANVTKPLTIASKLTPIFGVGGTLSGSLPSWLSNGSGGVLWQAASVSPAFTSGIASIVFPQAFPQALIGVFFTPILGTVEPASFAVSTTSYGLSGCNVQASINGAAASGSVTFSYLAIGA